MNREATFIVDEQGNVTFLTTDATDNMFQDQTVVKQRASHVEPDSFVFRMLFHLLRNVFGDRGRMSDFTRHWPCLWRINTQPTAGFILPTRYKNRQNAIAAEIAFLNDWFVEGQNAIQKRS